MNKIIFFELNEVPDLIFKSSFSKFRYNKNLSEFFFNKTLTKDLGHLSPWITWATLHRGITNETHNISDINQDISHLNQKYPTIMESLINQGYKVGVFGSMHSASVDSDKYKSYSFFIPEVFANNFQCKPKSLNNLQRFNLLMSRSSARVVDQSLPSPKIIFQAINSYLKHPFQFNGAKSVIKQLFSEILHPWKKVRRRTTQSLILFDTFMDLLNKEKPDFSTFFTNHVASNMHRFWEATYPEDYKKKISSDNWINRYKNEIDFSMQKTCYFINKLTEFVDTNNNYQLWILSSMGQAAFPNYKPGNSFWKVTDVVKFISSLCEVNLDLKELNQMIPCYGVSGERDSIKLIKEKLATIETNALLEIRSVTETTIAFLLDAYDLKEIWFKNKLSTKKIIIKGIKNIIIDEQSGSSAYHVPQGILYRYGNNLKDIDPKFLNKDGFLETQNIKAFAEEAIKL